MISLSEQDQITVEKSPNYFVDPVVPERVYKLNTSMKLLLILRDPVRRTISDYLQIMDNRVSTPTTLHCCSGAGVVAVVDNGNSRADLLANLADDRCIRKSLGWVAEVKLTVTAPSALFLLIKDKRKKYLTLGFQLFYVQFKTKRFLFQENTKHMSMYRIGKSGIISFTAQ